MSNELKPCPFCGGESELNHVNTACEWLYEVRCPECGCGTDYSDISDDAIAAWNRRAESELAIYKLALELACEQISDYALPGGTYDMRDKLATRRYEMFIKRAKSRMEG